MANGIKKYVWLGAAGAAASALLVYFAIFWPPVPRRWVQGAIGRRDVYRQAKLTDKDVGVAGTVKVTADDIQKFLQSPEFRSLAGNAQFNQLVANAGFQKSVQDAAAMKVQLAHSCAPVCPSPLVAQNQAQSAQYQQLMNNAQFQQFKSSSYYSLVMATPAFQSMVMNSQFVQLAGHFKLSNLAGNAALQQTLASQINAVNLQGAN